VVSGRIKIQPPVGSTGQQLRAPMESPVGREGRTAPPFSTAFALLFDWTDPLSGKRVRRSTKRTKTKEAEEKVKGILRALAEQGRARTFGDVFCSSSRRRPLPTARRGDVDRYVHLRRSGEIHPDESKVTDGVRDTTIEPDFRQTNRGSTP